MLIGDTINIKRLKKDIYNTYKDNPNQLDYKLRDILEKINYNDFVLKQTDFSFNYNYINWPLLIEGKNATIVLIDGSLRNKDTDTEIFVFDKDNNIIIREKLDNKELDRLPGHIYDYFIDENNLLIPKIIPNASMFEDLGIKHYQFVEGKMSPGKWVLKNSFDNVDDIKHHKDSIISIDGTLYNFDTCQVLTNDFSYVFSNQYDLTNAFRISDNEKEFIYGLGDIINKEKLIIGMNILSSDEEIYHPEFDGSGKHFQAIVFAKLDNNGNMIDDTLYAYYPHNEEVRRYGPNDTGFQYRNYTEKIEYIKNWLNGSTILENKKRKEEFKIYQKMKDWFKKN